MRQERPIVVITGASSGIGRKMAEHLTLCGYEVIGTSRKPDLQHPLYPLYQLDVTSDASVATFMETLLSKHPRVGVLINNAGCGIAGPVEDFSIDEVKEQLESVFFGVLRMNKAILPHFRKQGGGIILNVSSLAAIISLPYQAPYSAGKSALETYVDALRMEVKPFGIQVANINPADFRTGFTTNRRMVNQVSAPYKEHFEKLMKRYEVDEENGADPILVARLVQKLIECNRPLKPRYLVGKSSQLIAVPLKKLIGDQLYEKLMLKYWKV